uniref:Putative head tail connector protein n=1 Tax=viral metagenome TaxID=1070528 RepID=A0A6H1ZVG3_9ZZZZ
MPRPGAEELVKRFNKVENDRANWNSLWQDVADYVLPTRGGFSGDETPGTRRGTRQYDSTAVISLWYLAAGMHGLLTNPNMKWFALRLKGGDQGSGDVKTWLDDATETMHGHLGDTRFATAIQPAYMDLGGFGNTCVYMGRHPRYTVYFQSRPLPEIYALQNQYGEIDTIFRKFKFSARQATQQWGLSRLPEPVRNAADKDDDIDKEFDFLHAVYPRDDRDPEKADNLNSPWASRYICLADKKEIKDLSEGGYRYFPYAFARWDLGTGETYGRGPAGMMLADIKVLNEMEKTILKQAQKAVDPPLQMPHEGFLARPKLIPGAVNYYRALSNGSRGIEPLNLTTNLGIGLEMTDQKRAQIGTAFFNDVLIMAQDKKMTATEIIERVQERLMLMGPVLSRLSNELLQPIIEATFHILLEEGKIAPPPPDMEGQEYEIEYQSPVARAQRAEESKAISRWLEHLIAMAGVDPNVMDNANLDEAARETADLFGVPARLLNDERVVKAIREQKQQAAAMQMKQEQRAQLLQSVLGNLKGGVNRGMAAA